MKKAKKAITPIISIIILLLIVMALAAGAWFFLSGYYGTMTSKVIQLVMGSEENNTVRILNLGTAQIQSSDLVVLVDGEEAAIISLTPESIDPGSSSFLIFSTPITGQNIKVQIIGPANTLVYYVNIEGGAPPPAPYCDLTSANWNQTSAIEGTEVKLIVEGTNCDAAELSFEIWEYDGLVPFNPDDPVSQNPANATFIGTTAITTWTAEWQDDSGDDENPPEYYFIATLVNNISNDISSMNEPKLNVLQTAGPVEVWDLVFDGNNNLDEAYSVAVDSVNDVYVVGYGMNIVSSSSSNDWWIKKFDSSGNELWEKKIDGNSMGSAYYDSAESVAVDSSDNVYVVGFGSYLVSTLSNTDWWIKKFDSSGNELWEKKIDNYNVQERAHAAAVDSTNSVYMIGSSVNLTSDWLIKKFDSNGNELWEKMVDGGTDDSAYGAAIDSANNVYVVGFGKNLVSPSSDRDWWIKKFDSSGTELWEKKIDNNEGSDEAYSVAVDSNDDVYVVGDSLHFINATSQHDWWIKKFDSSGTELWDKKIDTNDSDSALSVAVDLSNNIYVVGYGSYLISNSSWRDWWIKKFDANGNEYSAWNLIYGGIGFDQANSVTIDSNNDVYIVGQGRNVSTTTLSDWWIKKFSN